MIQAPSLAVASRTSATPSSPARAACPTASTRASMAASARRTRPARCRRTAPAWRPRSASRRDTFSPATRSIRPTWSSPKAPWTREATPEADAIVTREPGLAVGVLTADCGPVLFADAEAGVVGAAHSGWKGALGGVLEATIAAMETLGAKRDRIRTALGPLIRQENYEVGPEFVARFTAEDPGERAVLHAVRKDRPRDVRPALLRGGAARARGRCAGRPGAVHLCGSRTLFQLPPHDAPCRAGLRPARQRDRAVRL